MGVFRAFIEVFGFLESRKNGSIVRFFLGPQNRLLSAGHTLRVEIFIGLSGDFYTIVFESVFDGKMILRKESL
jgi:hypothetical protein